MSSIKNTFFLAIVLMINIRYEICKAFDVLEENSENAEGSSIMNEVPEPKGKVDATIIIYVTVTAQQPIASHVVPLNEYINLQRKIRKVEKEKLNIEKEKADLRVNLTDYINRMNNLIPIVKRLACGKNLRYHIEIFLSKNVLIDQVPITQQKNCISNLIKYLGHRMASLRGVIKSLRKITMQGDKKNNSLFASSYKKLKELNILTIEIPKEMKMYDVDDSAVNSLKVAIIRLIEAENLEKAQEIFEKQSLFWNSIDESSEHVQEDISYLARKITKEDLESSVVHKKFEDPHTYTRGQPEAKPSVTNQIKTTKAKHSFTMDERYFIETLLNAEEILPYPGNEYYHECLWVMHNAKDKTEIKEMLKVLKMEWKDMNLGTRIHRFCYQFSSLHQILSKADIHAPETGKLPKECEPGSQDYIDYVNSLVVSNNNNSEIGLVARLLSPLPVPTYPAVTPKKFGLNAVSINLWFNILTYLIRLEKNSRRFVRNFFDEFLKKVQKAIK